MKTKIEEFYQEIKNKLKKCENYRRFDGFDLEFNNLCKLRSYIVGEYKIKLTDLPNEIYYFPMKYLNATLFPLNTNYISLNEDLSEYKFKIQYNNNFSRLQINCIINDIFKKSKSLFIKFLWGSALGNYLEIKIDEAFRNYTCNKFGFHTYNFRYLFSLVQDTKNSSNIIKVHRKNEKCLITQFFGEQYYNNCFILFLFQVYKIKQNELKTKYDYIFEANNVINYLKSIYGIEINRVYLTFILPYNNVTD